MAGTITKNLEKLGKECVLISGDKDYYQLVSPQTSLWRMVYGAAKKKYEKVYEINLTTYAVQKNLPIGLFEIKYGDGIMVEDIISKIPPEQFVDYLAVAGDKADNIPGVSGVGYTTIIPLLQKYGSLTAIYEAIETSKNVKDLAAQWKTELGIKTNPINALLKNKDNAFLSQSLAKIKTDIDSLPKDINTYLLNIDKTGVESVIKQYEMSSLAEFC